MVVPVLIKIWSMNTDRLSWARFTTDSAIDQSTRDVSPKRIFRSGQRVKSVLENWFLLVPCHLNHHSNWPFSQNRIVGTHAVFNYPCYFNVRRVTFTIVLMSLTHRGILSVRLVDLKAGTNIMIAQGYGIINARALCFITLR